MRHKVLPVAEIAQAVESVQEVFFQIKQGLGLVAHPEPKHTRHAVAAEKPCAVEVHCEGLMALSHLFARFDDGGDVVHRRTAQKL